MISRRPGLVFLSVLLSAASSLVGAGCGNYSNEDLEFMNALPESSDLRANIPPVTSAIALAHEAELARSTHETTRGFNGMLAQLVGIVDFVRSFSPTSRTPGTRVWGPFAADRKAMKNLDWQTRMIMSFDDVNPGQLDYEIAVHHIGNADTDWPVLIRGWFQAGGTARQGVGHVELLTAAARAEGFDASDFEMLDHLEIDYDTSKDPVSITMHITNLPVAGSPDPAAQATFSYKANAAGQGQMTFDLVGNLIMLTPAIEDMRVVSHWLSTGEGFATVTIVAGDGMGLKQTECWDRAFQATFNDKPWAPTEDVPSSPPGDPAGLCPIISDL